MREHSKLPQPSKCWDCAHLGSCPAKAPCENFEPYPYTDGKIGKPQLEILTQKEAIRLTGYSKWKYHILKANNEEAITERLHEVTGKWYGFLRQGDRKVLVREDEDE